MERKNVITIVFAISLIVLSISAVGYCSSKTADRLAEIRTASEQICNPYRAYGNIEISENQFIVVCGTEEPDGLVAKRINLNSK